jgi:hypothetical protein
MAAVETLEDWVNTFLSNNNKTKSNSSIRERQEEKNVKKNSLKFTVGGEK